MISNIPMCACGQPLHYTDPDIKKTVEGLIEAQGETIEVAVIGGKRFAVPRHYIALHGLKASELPTLAEKLGFKEVEDD